MTTKYGTAFVESEAILAAEQGDIDELDRIIDTMLPGERRRLADAAYRLFKRLNGPLTVIDALLREDVL